MKFGHELLKERLGELPSSMSVATMNAFTLLDDEGTMDATELAAKIPAAPKEAPKKVASEGKTMGKSLQEEGIRAGMPS